MILSFIKKSHVDYVAHVISRAKNRFGAHIVWQERDGKNMAEVKAEEGTFKLMDRNGDRRVDIFEFIPATVNPHSAFDIGVKILRDYADEAFDHKEDRPVKNPLSVPYLDRF